MIEIFALVLSPLVLHFGILFFKRYKKNIKKNLYQRVKNFIQQNNHLNACLILQEHLSHNPNDIKAYFTLINIYKEINDVNNEARYIKQLIKIGKFHRDFSESKAYKRIAELEELLGNKEASFSYYLDYLETEPKDQEILLKMSEISFQEKNFKVANFFFDQIESIFSFQNANIFFAKAITKMMIENSFEQDLFKKTYELEPDNEIFFLFYLLVQSKKKDYNKVIHLADLYLTQNEENIEEKIKYFLLEIIMQQYYELEDFLYAKVYARTCLETAKLYNWKSKIKQSSFLFVLICLKCGQIQEASEYLINLESEEPSNSEIQELADYTFYCQNKENSTEVIYFLDDKLKSQFSSLFNNHYLYEISGLELNQTFNIDKIIKKRGSISLEYNQLKGKRALSVYISSDELKFKEICKKIISSKNYKIESEVSNQGYGDADFISFIELDDKKTKVLFQFKKWVNASINDKYILNILNRIKNLRVEKCFLIGDGKIEKVAQKVIENNKDKIEILNGDDLKKLLIQLT